MIKIINTIQQIDLIFENKLFNFDKWKEYINSIYENSAHIFTDDIKEYFNSNSFSFEKDFLPIINNVYKNPSLEILDNSFCEVTDKLNEKIEKHFNNKINIDIVLYVGLCNGAGWVTNINNKDVILLGIEKILELNWQDINSMTGLIYHELGHVFHIQHGKFNQTSESNSKNFVWQLFTEGIAMYFEQVLVNDRNFFHQNLNGWKDWCDNHIKQIAKDFNDDLQTMNKLNQRYFGDWVNYNGYSDVGYYLGTKFIHSLIEKYNFTQLINLSIDEVYNLYLFYTEKFL